MSSRRFAHGPAAGLLALVLVLAATLAAGCGRQSGSASAVDFYRAPSTLPSSPGELLRSDAFTRDIPTGASARRILYTSTAADGSIVAASALVVAPRGGGGAHPVVLWTHGTTGVAQSCAPSLAREPFSGGVGDLISHAIERGWIVVAPDYQGMGVAGPSSYLLGRPEARSALDAVRAARLLPGLALDTHTVVWGHSQGGGAALWVGIEAPRYAPQVTLSGIAAVAPASDLLALAGQASGPFGALLSAYVLDSYSRAYPDVSLTSYLRPSAHAAYDAFIARCTSESAALLQIAAALAGQSTFSRPPATGMLRTRLEQNSPSTPSGVPTLIAQGRADQLIDPAVQRRFAAQLCRRGAAIEYRSYAGRDHLGVIAPDSPLIAHLLRWTEQRFAGAPAHSNCAALLHG